MEFEKPDLREVRRNIGRDQGLFDMVMALAEENNKAKNQKYL